MSTKDWIEKDYYKVLGVNKDAKPDEIKRAYRKLARDNHPDQNPGNPEAERRFKEISEANDVLSNEDKRKEYDEARRLFGGGGFRFPGAGTRTGAPMDDIFRNMGSGEGGFGDLFGGLFGGAGGTTRTTRFSTARGPRRGSDVEGEVTVDFVQAIEGVTVGMQMVSDAPCEACRGTGAKAGTVPRVCPTCEGSGMQTSTSGGVFAVTEPCRECRGRGMVVDDPCPVCHGSGRGKSTKTMQVRIPAGVTDGQRIRLKGKGGAGENGGAAGDLYVVVHVKAHPIFGRKGDNLTLTAPVTFTEAALGAEIEVPTLGGAPVKLRVPQGTPNGRTFRVRGKGVAKRDGSKGDLLVTVEVLVPAALNEQARQALNNYAAAVGSADPRAKLFTS
jgi:molecular chaperone DnaJ